MYLVRLVYTSTISEGFNEREIENILEAARKNNAKSNVTGLLCFNRKYFLQCLEGSRVAVNAIYHRILQDDRHHSAVMLDYKEIYQREFDQWNMGFMPESNLTRPTNMKYSNSPDFNPYDMAGVSAHELMIELRNTVPVL